MLTSIDSICQARIASPEPGGAGHVLEVKADPARRISPVVAHELNNLLTIIQGYADRLLLNHRENPALEAHLKIIADAARRAATIVQAARTPATMALPPRPKPLTPEPVIV